jgi:hypothetical protein
MKSMQHRFGDVLVRLTGQSARMGALPQLRAATDPKAVGGKLYAPRWITFGAPVVRGVRGRMADPAEHAALWGAIGARDGVALASILG